MAKTQNFIVGGVFLIGLALIGVFSVVVKNIPVFSSGKKLTIVFDRVAGLEPGHKVLASGMEVGKVSDLQLRDDGAVMVGMNLTHPLKLYKDYRISVKDTSALGGKYVDFEMGTPESGEIPLSYLSGQVAQESLQGTAQPSFFDDPNLRELFISLKKIAKDIEHGKGTIGLLVTQRELYDNILEASKDLKSITAQIRNAQGTIGKLLYDGKLYEKIERIVTNIETITEDLRLGKGTIGQLINDDSLYLELKDALASTKSTMDNLTVITNKLKRGEGTVGKLLVEEDVYLQLESALTDARKMMSGINDTIRQINEGQGTLAALLRDEVMAKDLKDTLQSLRVVAARMKKGEGTIGKLLTDETLYNELHRVIKNFSDSIEDTREQVPITAFTSILFRAF